MTDEEALNAVVKGITSSLREKDIEIGVMDRNWKPLNGLLSARENKRCWEYLAEWFVRQTMQTVRLIDVGPDFFYCQWLEFLPMVESVVRYGLKNKVIENIINNSGISKTTWIKFLD